MKVSFILCTKNGGDRLLECLRSIERLNAPDDMELFLVDNGSTDGVSFQHLKDFSASSRFSCHVLQTFIPGNSAGRNIALAEAKGDLLIFIDDDCYADPDLVRDWVSLFSSRDIGFGSGMILRNSETQSWLGCVESTEEEFVPAHGFVRRGLIQGSNMAFRRTCLDAAGPFDVRFGAGTPFAGEEWDVALRASLAGWSGGYFPKPKVSHDHRRTDADARERMLFYDYGAGAVYAKNIFGRRGLQITRKYLAELRALRRDRTRFGKILKGYVDFHLKRAVGF